MKTLLQLKSIADCYRTEEGLPAHGVVILFNDMPDGWMNELRDPEHHIAGCIAIDNIGTAWLATGGNTRDGATCWMVLPSANGELLPFPDKHNQTGRTKDLSACSGKSAAV